MRKKRSISQLLRDSKKKQMKPVDGSKEGRTKRARKDVKKVKQKEMDVVLDLGKMDVTYHNEKTFNGYDVDLIKSACQKYVRRSEPKKAIRCAIELDLFCRVPDFKGEKIRTNLWNRLRVMALEDVSLANVHIFQLISGRLAFLLKTREARKKAKDTCEDPSIEEKRALVEVVSFVSSSKHARVPSHYRAVFCNDEVLSYVSENHKDLWEEITNKQRADSVKKKYPLSTKEKANSALSDLVHSIVACMESKQDAGFKWLNKLLEKGNGPTKHHNRKDIGFLALDIFRWFATIAYPDWFTKAQLAVFLSALEVLLEWYKLLSNKERILCIYMPFLMIVLKDSISWDDSQEGSAPQYSDEEIDQMYAKNLNGKFITLDSYVVDMHTKRGRQKGSGTTEFALEGSMVTNEDTNVVNALYKQLYNFSKGVEISPADEPSPPPSPSPSSSEGISLVNESDVFEKYMRAQLVTSNSKQDTYFATVKAGIKDVIRDGDAAAIFKEGDHVLVKGPYARAEPASIAVGLNELKKQLPGLYAMKMCSMELVPDAQLDSFPQPVGFRKKVDASKPYSFLVCEDLCAAFRPLPVEIRSSKCWPSTEVPDYDELAQKRRAICFGKPSLLKSHGSEHLTSFILALCFRFIFQIPDTAMRNFLFLPGTGALYSIDEDTCMKPKAVKDNSSSSSSPSASLWSSPLSSTFARQEMSVLSEHAEQNADRICGVLREWSEVLALKATTATAKLDGKGTLFGFLPCGDGHDGNGRGVVEAAVMNNLNGLLDCHKKGTSFFDAVIR